MAEGNGIAPWKAGVKCSASFHSDKYGAKWWVIMNLWSSQDKLPLLQTKKWKNQCVLWTHGYQASSLMACCVMPYIYGTPAGSGRQPMFLRHECSLSLLSILQQRWFLWKSGSGAGHSEQSFQNTIGTGLERPKVTLIYICWEVTPRVPSSLYFLVLMQHWFRINCFFLLHVKASQPW